MAFVEPPVAMTIVIAFSNAFRVMMSRGLISRSMRCSSAGPTAAHSAAFSGANAGDDEEYGSDMPRVSMALDIVFAVYIPPHAPGPGQELRTMSARSSSPIAPATNWPYAWNAEMMSSLSC